MLQRSASFDFSLIKRTLKSEIILKIMASMLLFFSEWRPFTIQLKILIRQTFLIGNFCSDFYGCSNGAKFSCFYYMCLVLNYSYSVSSYLYSVISYVYSVLSYLYSVISYKYSVSSYLYSATSYIYIFSILYIYIYIYIFNLISFYSVFFFVFSLTFSRGRTSCHIYCHAADLEIIKLN